LISQLLASPALINAAPRILTIEGTVRSAFVLVYFLQLQRSGFCWNVQEI